MDSDEEVPSATLHQQQQDPAVGGADHQSTSAVGQWLNQFMPTDYQAGNGALLAGIACSIVIIVIVVGIARVVMRRRKLAQQRQRRLLPVLTFLGIVGDSSDTECRKLRGALHHDVLRKTQPGVIKAIGRCIRSQLGAFEGLDKRHKVEFLQGANNAVEVRCVAKFTHEPVVSCTVSWVVVGDAGQRNVKISSFHLAPPTERQLRVDDHLVASDFEQVGESFVGFMFSKTPQVAVDLMGPTLKARYSDLELLRKEMMSVVRAIGGFKNRELDVTAVSSGITTIQKRQVVELQLQVKGEVRDCQVAVKGALLGRDFLVVHFAFTGLPAHQQVHFVDEPAAAATGP